MNRNNKNRNILFVAGGTGGHIFPALAVYEFLHNSNVNLLFATDKRGLNNKELYKLDPYLINAKGFEGKSIMRKIFSICLLFFSFIKSFIFLKRKKISIVIGFGSYVQVPFVLAALLLNKKILLHEGNAVIGRANRIFWKYINIRTSAFNLDSLNINTITVGMPVRKEILKLYDNKYSSPKKKQNVNLVILGGSQGSELLSLKLCNCIIKLPKNLKNRLIIAHQVRANDLKRVKENYKKNNIKSKVQIFIEDISKHLEEASLVISRAGSSTIWENSIAGIPAAYFPIFNSVGDHQFKNADVFRKKEAAWIFSEKDLDEGRFFKFLIKTLDNYKILNKKAIKNRSLASPNATKDISNLIMRL